MKNRCYRTSGVNFKDVLLNMKKSENPVYVIGVETSGLDCTSDDVIQINLIKCHFNGRFLSEDLRYSSNIHINMELSDEISKITGISAHAIETAPSAETIMKEIFEITGGHFNLIGINMSKFTIPFFKKLGFQSGYMPIIDNFVDVSVMSATWLDLPKYTYKNICDELFKKPADKKVDNYLNIYNKSMENISLGMHEVTIYDSSLWKKSYTCRFIYFKTDCGKVALNCNTGFWVETTPGYFDEADMDNLTKQICTRFDCANIWAYIKKFGN